jgi:hypothetical protein
MDRDGLPEVAQESDDTIHLTAHDDTDDGPLDESLTDEIAALIDDGKTYAQAELAFQKTRAGFVADRGKSAFLYGLFALGFIHLALIALVVGSMIALMPLIGPWGATLAVTGILLLGALLLLMGLRSRAREIGDAFKDETR